jgi:N-methylhydantoinase A/oxoprolinase/acetone carboxylase beta subunit
MTVVLGIDTGGTYTDAALVDHESGEVLAGAKALTTRHDLSIGIGEAMEAALGQGKIAPTDVRLVALSTTLATNAIVEGQGRPICLLLIGYDRELIEQYGFERDLATKDVVYVRGGHDIVGDEVAPLDVAAAREAILARHGEVEGFAVSGYFSVRNPAHELQVRDLVEELTASSTDSDDHLPVTCGHELTTRLDSVRRATTVALNAQLIPLLKDLIATVRHTLNEMDVAAPLMVVKGDGSLMRADWAMRRPVETILSGPAASVVGAWHLAGRRDVWTVDVGGTTTDIAALRDGRPRLNAKGANVGGWRTMVRAADVHTVGLGGDSHVRLNSSQLHIGPRRVVPLSLLASDYPEVVDRLQQQAQQKSNFRVGQLVLSQGRDVQGLSANERALLEELEDGPRLLTSLLDIERYGAIVLQRIDRLESRQLVLRSAFTPTDALHVLGRLDVWNAEAARIGARMLAAQAGLTPKALCEQVVDGVSDRVSQALVTKILGDEGVFPEWEEEPSAAALLTRALGHIPDSDLGCKMRLRQPLVAIGAPVEAYMPRASEQLNTELVIPDHAEVANAVGAVTGSVVQQVRVTIQPLDEDKGFRLHLPDCVCDFSSLKESVRHAEETMPERVEKMARRAGADHIEVRMERFDNVAPVRGGWAERIYLSTELTFTAVGRPSIAA